MKAFTLDFSKKTVLCANSEEELSGMVNNITQAHPETNKSYMESRVYVAIIVPVVDDSLLESGSNSFLCFLRDQLLRFIGKLTPKFVATATDG